MAEPTAETLARMRAKLNNAERLHLPDVILSLKDAEALIAAAERVAELRAALLACSTEQQFGPCWCRTLANIYCVGQPQCKAATKALEPTPKGQQP